MKAGSTADSNPSAVGGSVRIAAGVGANGGDVVMFGGDGNIGGGGNVRLQAGNSEVGKGGAFFASAGSSMKSSHRLRMTSLSLKSRSPLLIP